MIDTEEQWEHYIGAYTYSKFFVSCYNSSIGSVLPIYLKHTRAHKDHKMLETTNMNNWHQVLDSLLSMSD